jgi:prepilin-type N-terminal cleavage/methylation domain-containing protein
MKVHARPRAAFTVIELLVVLSIIALLATLSIAAVLRVQESQRGTNTSIHLRKAQMGLDQQWKAAIDRIKAEEPHELIYQITTNPNGTRDNARAKALHMKLRLRQEFPQSYAEVRMINVFTGPYLPLQSPSVYGPKPLYLAAIGAGNGTAGDEAAALLLVVLAQGRGGTAFNAEEIGPVQTRDMGGKPMRVLVDAWGNPMCLRRWATDAELKLLLLDPINNELNLPPFVTPAQVISGNCDPQDPDGRLRFNTWAGKAQAQAWFTSVLANTDPFDGRNRGPYIVSAGKDAQYTTDDDLYSFRLQSAGKGN